MEHQDELPVEQRLLIVLGYVSHGMLFYIRIVKSSSSLQALASSA
jgi:hypothetical protein